MNAYCLLRDQPHYRHDAFVAGLKAAGYSVDTRVPIEGRPGDVLVIWNRYGHLEQIADRFEATGGTVLVAENGYIGKDDQGRQLYAIARRYHNGRGEWPHMDGRDGSRWKDLGIETRPWVGNAPGMVDGEETVRHFLICGNRSFGTIGNIMPVGWEKDVRRRLQHPEMLRELRLRFHPGNDEPGVSLEKDLENAYACVIWSSSCGVHALVAGVPVFCEANWWICKSASQKSLRGATKESCDKRRNALNAMAWAQWTINEITSGLPFNLLCTSTAPATHTA